MSSTDRQRWAIVPPGLAWKPPGLPPEWCRVVERNDEAMNPEAKPGYVWLEVRGRATARVGRSPRVSRGLGLRRGHGGWLRGWFRCVLGLWREGSPRRHRRWPSPPSLQVFGDRVPGRSGVRQWWNGNPSSGGPATQRLALRPSDQRKGPVNHEPQGGLVDA